MQTTLITPPTKVNGHLVLASSPLQYGGGMLPGHLVLCVREHNGRVDEYITWLVCTEDDGETWHAFHGHYDPNLFVAVEDYKRRAGI